MASTPLHDKLKAPFRDDARTDSNGILRCLDRTAVTGDNQRYMSMYDWIARWYDFGERWIGKLKYGDGIPNMRRQLMQELPWRNGCSALYVSIGTGADLRYLPASIDAATLDLVGLDISLGMLRRCRRVWRRKLDLSLVHASAEDLPFADHSFDIVFHVGGINFFNDKKRALQEMARVARPGTRIMIADETADFVDEQYKKSLFTRSYFDDTQFDLKEIIAAIPAGMQDVNTQLIWNNRFYCITFHTPDVC